MTHSAGLIETLGIDLHSQECVLPATFRIFVVQSNSQNRTYKSILTAKRNDVIFVEYFGQLFFIDSIPKTLNTQYFSGQEIRPRVSVEMELYFESLGRRKVKM